MDFSLSVFRNIATAEVEKLARERLKLDFPVNLNKGYLYQSRCKLVAKREEGR